MNRATPKISIILVQMLVVPNSKQDIFGFEAKFVLELAGGLSIGGLSDVVNENNQKFFVKPYIVLCCVHVVMLHPKKSHMNNHSLIALKTTSKKEYLLTTNLILPFSGP